MVKILLKNKSEETVERSEFLRSLIAKRKGVSVSRSKVNRDFDFYFGTDLAFMEDPKELLITLLNYSEEEGTKTILDVSEDLFSHPLLGPFLVLCVVSANYVTCSSEEMQEQIYKNTGRLAYILKDLKTLKKQFKNPKTPAKTVVSKDDVKVLWFGELEDIFSVKQEQTQKRAYNIETFTVDSLKIKLGQFPFNFSDFDLVYLPKSLDEKREESRVERAEIALKKGLLVVAPDLNSDEIFDSSLEEGVSFYLEYEELREFLLEKQKQLYDKKAESKRGQTNQIEKVFELAEEDTYLENLDYYIEVEGII